MRVLIYSVIFLLGSMPIDAMRRLPRAQTMGETKRIFDAAALNLNQDAFKVLGVPEFSGQGEVETASFKENLQAKFLALYKKFNPKNLPESDLSPRIQQQQQDLANMFRVLYVDEFRRLYNYYTTEGQIKADGYADLINRLMINAHYFDEPEIIDQLGEADAIILSIAPAPRAAPVAQQPEEKKRAAEPKQGAPKAPARRPVSPPRAPIQQPARPVTPPRGPAEQKRDADDVSTHLQLLAHSLLNLSTRGTEGQAAQQPEGERKAAAQRAVPATQDAALLQIARLEAALIAVRRAQKEEREKQAAALAAAQQAEQELREKQVALGDQKAADEEKQILRAENKRLADELKRAQQQADEAKEGLARAAEERQRIREQAAALPPEVPEAPAMDIPDAPAFGEPPVAPPLDEAPPARQPKAPAQRPAQPKAPAGGFTAEELKAQRARQQAAGQRPHEETAAAKKAREEAEAKRRAALTEEERAQEDKAAQGAGLLGEIQRGIALKRAAERKETAADPDAHLTPEQREAKRKRDKDIADMVARRKLLEDESDDDDDGKDGDDKDWEA